MKAGSIELLELDLQAVVSWLMWVLGSELRSSVRSVGAFTC